MGHWLVIGAGSGGCVAACRLSDDPNRSVTLLEAGPDLGAGSARAVVDGADALAALDEPGRTYSGLAATRTAGGTPAPYPAGRGIGGSSAVNAMLALRGDPSQYADWGWSDASEAWARVAIPAELPSDHELGVVDRALLASDHTAFRVPLTRRDGRRVTSADAYVVPHAGRPNLNVLAETAVERVVLEGRRAAGVVLTDGTEFHAKRVVVAAGALHTPALLLRSGVDTAGIGAGLQDHASVAITLELRDGPAGRGGLVASALFERGAVNALPINHTTDGVHAALAVALMRPAGRGGRVELDPENPRGEPRIDLDLFADERDLVELRSGVRLLLDLLGRDPFREIVAAAYIDDSGTTTDALTDDASIDRWLRTAPGVYSHAASTCAIGTVLDERGAVRGYDGLYVCDASAFPSVPATNPHLPVTMLAERLASHW